MEKRTMSIRCNPFYLMALIYLVFDMLALALMVLLLAGIAPALSNLGWLRVHLLTIGVVVQAILGTLPGIVAEHVDSSDGGRPSNKRTWAIWWLVNASFLALLYAMPAGAQSLAAIAAGGILLAIVVLLFGLPRALARARLEGPTAAASRARRRCLLAGPVFLLIGILMAIGMLLRWPAPGGYSGLVEAHIHANVWGFVGLIVAAVLLDAVPRYRGEPLPWPRLVPATSWLLIMGAAGLTAGPWLALLPVTVLGLAIYVVGTVLLLMNLAGAILAGDGWGWAPDLAHVAAAYAWLMVPAVAAPVMLVRSGHLPSGDVQTAAISAVVAGWMLQLVLGILLPMIGQGRIAQERGNAGSRRSGHVGHWIGVIVFNLGVAAFWLWAFRPADALLASAYLLIVVGCLSPLVSAIVRFIRIVSIVSSGADREEMHGCSNATLTR
jgi:hypothetical protein